MDVSVISNAVNVASQTLALSNLLFRQPLGSHTLTISDSPSTDHSAHASATIFDAIAPPPVKPNKFKTSRRTLLRKKRRTRRRSYDGGDEEVGYYGGGDDGAFGGGNWGGGRGWNLGGQNWNDESWDYFSGGFAYGFIYEVIYWIALSNCVHFAFKKFVRFFAEREKIGMRLTTVC